MITKKYYKLIRVSHTDSEYFRITNISNEIGEFSFLKEGSGGSGANTQYSTDGVNWNSYDFTNLQTIQVSPNSNIYFRGTTWGNAYDYNYYHFNFTKNYKLGGNILSLFNYNTMTTESYMGGTIRSSHLFRNQTNLIYADFNIGNVTELKSHSFSYMFEGCSNLLSVPDVSHVTKISDSAMQYTCKNCASLETGFDLSNVTDVPSSGYALNNLYYYCVKINNVTTPNIQNITRDMLNDWLAGAGSQATGTKVVNVPTGATIATGTASGIPSGWTRADY